MATIQEYKASKNIAEMLDKKTLEKISSQVMAGFELDLISRSEWDLLMERALKLTKQIKEPKRQPNLSSSANVKYPLISQAAIDFAARVYPELIQGNRVVNAKVIGEDPLFQKAERANRVSKHMSYQLLDESGDWEEGQDKLLNMLPVFGTVFKKTYFDPIREKSVSHVLEPADLVVNQNIFSLEDTRRVTHIIYMYKNDIVERVRAGLFLEHENLSTSVFPDSPLEVDPGEDNDTMLEDEDSPLVLLEQHCWLDLDDDGYDEPYIVTLHKDSGKIFRIFHRYKEVSRNGDEIKRIIPEQYFIDYHFIRNPDGGFYSVGLGTLLTPINESINTLINQLIDSGTLNNQQSGFIGKGIRLRNGTIDIKQGKYTVLDTATGADLRNNIFPIPTKEPSGTLFNLLGLLIEAGKDLSSSTDVLQGKQPAQNVPATTILTLEKQGLKVFTSILKRIYRSMRKEFKRLFELNQKHISDIEYQRALDSPFASIKIDYNVRDLDISPVADPSAASDRQRLERARVLFEMQTLDPYAVSRYYLEALQIDDNQIDFLLPPPNPNDPPPPDVQKVLAEVEKLKLETQELVVEQQLKLAEIQLKQQDTESRSREAEARIQKMLSDSQVNIRKMEIVADKSAVETELKARSQLNTEVQGDKAAEQKDVELMIEAAEALKDDSKRDNEG